MNEYLLKKIHELETSVYNLRAINRDTFFSNVSSCHSLGGDVVASFNVNNEKEALHLYLKATTQMSPMVLPFNEQPRSVYGWDEARDVKLRPEHLIPAYYQMDIDHDHFEGLYRHFPEARLCFYVDVEGLSKPVSVRVFFPVLRDHFKHVIRPSGRKVEAVKIMAPKHTGMIRYNTGRVTTVFYFQNDGTTLAQYLEAPREEITIKADPYR